MIKKILKNKKSLIVILTILYLAINLSYTFLYCDYQSLVWGDMKQFWARAENHLNGDIFSINQWSVWPVLYHILLAGQIYIADHIGMHAHRLEWCLFFGILLNSTGIFFIYNIAETVARKYSMSEHFVAGVAGFLFAISIPHIHLNAFILSESYAFPAMMAAFYLVICQPEKRFMLILAGLLFGVASLTRPALGLIGIVYICLLFVERESIIQWIKRSALFTGAFAVIIAGGSVLTGYISGWKLVKPGGNGAIVFYIHHCEPNVWMIANKVFLKKGEVFNQCKPFTKSRPPYNDMVEIEGLKLSDFRECNGMIYGQPPALLLKSDNEILPSQFHSAPPWDSGYYWKKGIQCIEKDGWINHFVEHTKMFSNIFLFLFYPDNEFRGADKKFTKTGTKLYLMLSLWIDVFLAMSIFGTFLIRSKGKGKKILLSLSVVPVLVVLTSYMFAIDGRYLVPSMFVGYIVFAVYLVDSIQEKKKRKEKRIGDSLC